MPFNPFGQPHDPPPEKAVVWVYDDETCDKRGAGLTHTTNGTLVCGECRRPCLNRPADEATQRRLAALRDAPTVGHMFQPTITGLCLRCRQSQVGGAHDVEAGVPPYMEPRMATGKYEGPENGPGRGALTTEWKSWARIALTPVDSEYR